MRRLLIIPLLLILFAAPSRADTYRWDGGGANNSLGTNANWEDDVAPAPDDPHQLIFLGSTRTTPTASIPRDVFSLEFWSEEAASYRAEEFYPYVDDWDTGLPLGRDGEYGKPFLHLTTAQRTDLGRLAGLYKHDPWRRNRRFEEALAKLEEERQLVKVVVTRWGDRLLFPLPRAGAWGT